jgi:hypothetical protein
MRYLTVTAKTGDVLAAMRRNPAGDWTIEDIRRVCERRGWQCLTPSRSSHWKVAAQEETVHNLGGLMRHGETGDGPIAQRSCDPC